MAIATTSLGVLSDILPGVTAIRSVKRAFLLIAFPLAVTISSIYASQSRLSVQYNKARRDR